MRASPSKTIRTAISNSGLSRYRICLECGVEESTLSRFMSGSSAITTDTLDKLAAVLRLRIVCDGPRAELLRRVSKEKKK